MKRHELLQELRALGSWCLVLVVLSGICWPIVVASIQPKWLLVELPYIIGAALMLFSFLTFKKAKQLLALTKSTSPKDELPVEVLNVGLQFEVLVALMATLVIGLFVTCAIVE